MNYDRLRLTLTLVTCLSFLSPFPGFVIKKRFATDERDTPGYRERGGGGGERGGGGGGGGGGGEYEDGTDDDYKEALMRNKYYLNYDGYNDVMDTDSDNNHSVNDSDIDNDKREFSPDRLRQQVREKMEEIVRGKDAGRYLDELLEREGGAFDSVMRKMMTKQEQEVAKNTGSLRTSGRIVEEKSTQTKIESNGDKGVAIVTGQTMESSSAGNGSAPLVKVAKVVAVATKDGREGGEWKVKPLEEKVKVITPSPTEGKENGKKGDGDESFESLFGGRAGFLGDQEEELERYFEKEMEGGKTIRRKRNVDDFAELNWNQEPGRNDVDLLKSYIMLQDAENRHLMQALDLASEVELGGGDEEEEEGERVGGDPRTIDEQMFHMRKALEDERALNEIRKQIQLSVKNLGSKRTSSPSHLRGRIGGGQTPHEEEEEDYDYGGGVFLERYTRRIEADNDGDEGEDEEGDISDDDEGGRDGDAKLMEELAGDITLDRHKLRNDELMDRLTEMMDQSDEGWKGHPRSKKRKPVDPREDDPFNDDNLRKLLKAYQKHYTRIQEEPDYPVPSEEEDYVEEYDDNDLRRKILQNLARYPESGYRLNPFLRNITKVEIPGKRFVQSRPPMMSPDEDVESAEPWCPKAARLVDNCLYARLNGLLPDSEAVDLCNAHQLCYKCGSSNGVTAEECDRAFMERSKELCHDEMACKKQAASLFVTMAADRQFYTEFEAPEVCTHPCVTSILYTDRSD